jgi:hypothetical protein
LENEREIGRALSGRAQAGIARAEEKIEKTKPTPGKGNII